jgi:hypothetical protein
MTAKAALAVVGLALALAGCGDDEGRVSQEPAGTETSTATTPTDTVPVETAPAQTEIETAPEDAGAGLSDGHGGGQAAPEERPGGAGDEIPASTQALFTGRAGRITPRIVRVPPFIAVRVQLRSADGAAYELSGGGETLRAAGRPARPVVFDGLRPGRRLSLKGTGGRVIIEASAEPGP